MEAGNLHLFCLFFFLILSESTSFLSCPHTSDNKADLKSVALQNQ